ncbi:MAG: hypothetical protein NT086_01355 [Proteobacteria bacterium]|nr:hypothetical protein [Pseudomonadota bacterium]
MKLFAPYLRLFLLALQGINSNPINLSEMFFVGRVKPASDAEKYAGFTRPTMIQCL